MSRSSLLLCLLTAACAGGKAAPAGPLNPAQLAKRAMPSIVMIQTDKEIGTGFVVWKDGRIATNLHVLNGAERIKVKLADGRESDRVELLAIDKAHDLAILRAIDFAGLEVLPLSDNVQVGERVVAIGHPLGLGNTVSDGIVSAVRELDDDRQLIQITAPIAPGSSGGPLLNDRGEVIAVATLIVTQGQNLNFAVPVRYVRPMLLKDRLDPRELAAAANDPADRQPPPMRPTAPTHDPAVLFAGCEEQAVKDIGIEIVEAIKRGAPLFNNKDHQGCYLIYRGAAEDITQKIPGCAAVKTALKAGIDTSTALPPTDYTAKAWAMRDAFDGILRAIGETLK